MTEDASIPLALLAEEAERWRVYGEAVRSGAPSRRRRMLFGVALKATDACLAVLRAHRDAQAATAKAA